MMNSIGSNLIIIFSLDLLHTTKKSWERFTKLEPKNTVVQEILEGPQSPRITQSTP